jgi:asparagine synthase (glutamine-hydrolysing)
MCGIAGVVTLGNQGGPTSSALPRRMASLLRHRGPDDEGVWESPTRLAALSHRRLAIVDLSPLGRNPMLWDGGRLAITYNGEIYNFHELRQELERLGYRFRSQTDTEVVLAAYDQWGVECLDRFAGMFAFGLWDESRHRLWLVRDRLGKKPLYFAEHHGTLTFASELKALLADDGFSREIDPEALRMYLRYGYIPAPYTIYKGARKLEPAHYLLCEGGSVSNTRYWDPLQNAQALDGITESEAENRLETLLTTAVRQRRIADVPLGAFLSGGIDSSLVVALMTEQSSAPVQTHTVRFENPSYNEADHAAAVARHLGTDHHERTCGSREMLAIVDDIPDIYDEPFADSSAIPTYLVSSAARTGVTVALSGDGGDELFFGYPRYRYYADTQWVLGLPEPTRRVAAGIAGRFSARRVRRIADVLRNESRDRYSRFIAWHSNEAIERMSGRQPMDAPLYRDMFERSRHVPSALRPGLLDVVSYLPDDILAKVDRASMAVSLEVRCPLLDHRVVEFALGLPVQLKRRGRVTKRLLRKLLYKRVPAALVERPKMGFGVPLADWFRGPLRNRMHEYVCGDDLANIGLDPVPIRSMWNQFTSGRYHRPDLLWQAFVLVAWARRFVTVRTAA